jgi:hypothetical protein
VSLILHGLSHGVVLNWDTSEPATFVAAFNDEDPGVDSIAQRCKINDSSFVDSP